MEHQIEISKQRSLSSIGSEAKDCMHRNKQEKGKPACMLKLACNRTSRPRGGYFVFILFNGGHWETKILIIYKKVLHSKLKRKDTRDSAHR